MNMVFYEGIFAYLRLVVKYHVTINPPIKTGKYLLKKILRAAGISSDSYLLYLFFFTTKVTHSVDVDDDRLVNG